MKTHKIGRNDPCPCGSGKKFKKCHGASSIPRALSEELPLDAIRVQHVGEPPRASIAHGIEKFHEQQQREAARVRRYGHIRPEIAIDFKGYKFVAIGGSLLYLPSEKCRFLPDVLLAYIPHLFGKDWFEREIAKSPEERHPVMQWRTKGMNYMNEQPQFPDGSYGATPTGPLQAYMTFAYDTYVVANNGGLDKRLIERLMQKSQFQGARHELFAEATCLRAGYSVEHENEKDPNSRHAEFTATHIQSGQIISVEAKSKHRPGVLGQPGERENSTEVNLRFGYLLNDAVAKQATHPLVVFLDMNMPFETARRFLSPPTPHPFILKTLNQMRKQHGGMDPITQLIITNHPNHYTKDHEIPNRAHMMGQISLCPLKPARIDALMAITHATNLYGNIPQELPNGVQS